MKCATPLTSLAAIDPLGRIQAQGDTYRKAANHPNKFIVVLGIWLIFAPLPIIIVASNWLHLSEFLTIGEYNEYPQYFISYLFENKIGLFIGIINTIFSLGSFAVYSAIVIKTTKNYFRIRRKIK